MTSCPNQCYVNTGLQAQCVTWMPLWLWLIYFIKPGKAIGCDITHYYTDAYSALTLRLVLYWTDTLFGEIMGNFRLFLELQESSDLYGCRITNYLIATLHEFIGENCLNEHLSGKHLSSGDSSKTISQINRPQLTDTKNILCILQI